MTFNDIQIRIDYKNELINLELNRSEIAMNDNMFERASNSLRIARRLLADIKALQELYRDNI